MTRRILTRREVLKLVGAGAGGATFSTLAGCSPAATSAPAAEALPTLAAQAAPTAGALMATGKTAATYAEGQASYGWYEEWHPAEKVELVVWGPPGPDEEPWLKSLKDGIKRFEAKYPEITVKYEPTPWDDVDTKVSAAVASKQGPDILFEFDREADFPRRGAIRPFDDIVDAKYIKDHKFYEVRPLEDNRLYWLHTSIMGPILYANKTLLTEKGYKPSDIPTTWDLFGKFCKELTKWDGDTMLQAGFGFNGYAKYIWDDMMYQQKAHVSNRTKSFINSPESENAWQMLVDFYDKYKINSRDFLAFDEGFGAGKSAIAQVWTWFGSTLEGNYPDIDWAPALYPTFTGQGPYGRFDYDGSGWMVTTMAQGDKEKAAVEFFKYHLHDYQYLVERSHTAGLVLVTEPHPDYEALFASVESIEKPSQAERRSQSLAVLSKQFAGGMVFPGEVAAPFDQLWTKMQDAILVNGRPIKEVLAEYEKEYDQVLKDTKFWITPDA